MDSSHPGEARRQAVSLCHELGFDESRIGQVALVVTELATNLVKHTAGAGGELVFSPIKQGGMVGLDILSLDKGLGMVNIGECLMDGHSTTGSLGTGLGAIRRLSSAFDIYSSPGQGTAVFSRLWGNTPPEFAPALDVGAVCLPKHGEQACGDAWAMKQSQNTTLFMLADGLGHGQDAAIAANRAVSVFEQHAPRSPEELVSLIHTALCHTRGAAVAVVEVAFGRGLVRFVGVGNISGSIISGATSCNLISCNGTAGLDAHKVKEFTYPWPAGGLLVLHSDGVATHWSLETYPGLMHKHPALIASVLFRDFQRLNDDSTVVVAKAGGRRGLA